MEIFLFWVGGAVVVGVGGNTRRGNFGGWFLLALAISPLLAGLLLLALPRIATAHHVVRDPRWNDLRSTPMPETSNKSRNMNMTTKLFPAAVAILLTMMLGLLIHVMGGPVASPPAPKISTAQPWSPEQIRDFTRRVIEACDRLPVGDRNRPSQDICGARR
jgi:hypothetical protein